MNEILVSHAADFVGKDVILKGWVYNFRTSGKIYFLQLRDGSGFIQAVASQKDLGDELWKKINDLTLESSVILKGKITKHPKQEEYELQIKDVEVLQVSQDYPIGKKEHGPDFLLDNRHLWLRSRKQWAIQRVRNAVINATYEWFNKNDFIKIDSPILTPAACEGTTTLFEIDYFGFDKAYLSQSGQLYLEAAIMSHGRVFDFGPVFRAEKSKTRRHLTEFWMMDAEMAFIDHKGNLEIQEQLIYHIIQHVLKTCKNELTILERDIAKLEAVKLPFKRMTHAETVELLQGKGSSITEESDLGAEDETMLTENETQPIFIEKYPARVKAFYMKRDPENYKLVLCADLLAPEGFGEIIGGSQREEDFDVLVTRIKEHNLPSEAFKWYLDLRKYGSVTHSGFGYGLERIVGWLSGTRHIRETIPFPRLINRLNP